MSQRQQIQPSSPSATLDDEQRQKVRITYEKGDAIKFISHQDEFRAWERALRRSGLPLLYKQGFNPQPHVQFASPLGVGFSGLHELVDITFSPPIRLEEAMIQIAASLPPGLTIHSVEETELKSQALQTLLIGADYSIAILARCDEASTGSIVRALTDFMSSSEEWRTRERKGRTYSYNLRPLVLELAYGGYDADLEEHSVFLRVQQREGATGRPDEVVSALGLDSYARRLCRNRLYFAHDAEDVALFAQYSVVTKAQIADPNAPPPRRRRRRRSPKRPAGRSISERAGDEIG